MALRLIYPPRCLGCGGLVESDFGLCGPCWRDTPFIGGLACDGCGLPLPGGRPGEVARCDGCLADPPPWAQGRAVMLYEGMGRKLVLGLKHGDRHDIAAPGRRLAGRDGGGDRGPRHRHRADPAALAATGAAWLQPVGPAVAWAGPRPGGACGAGPARPVGTPRATPSLDGRQRAERRAILKGAIRVTPRYTDRLAGRPVLLVDDVLTSGATFSAATRACQAAGAASVAVLALARVGKAP